MSGSSPNSVDLLGDSVSWDKDLYSVPRVEPGRTVDLSGLSSSPAPATTSSLAPSSSWAQSSFSSSNCSTSLGSGQVARGPSSLEGGGGGGISLGDLSPANIMRQLSTRPVTELVAENGRLLMDAPRHIVRAYTSVAQRFLKPWSEFGRVRPTRTMENLRQASQRGEIQIHLQRNVLANVRAYCPNYAFIFLTMMFWFVCTSPVLLAMLGATGGGWSHALRSDNFRNRPWTLQLGGVCVPLGANVKMAMMTLPTLLMLHFFMGPVLWSAALYSGGIGLTHAALRDRDDEKDEDGRFGQSTVRIEELP